MPQWVRIAAVAEIPPGGAREFVVGDRNLLETDGQYRYEYDEQGNRLLREELATGRTTRYRWDLMNRLVAIEQREHADGPILSLVEYRDDALGRRVAKQVTSDTGAVAAESFWSASRVSRRRARSR